MSSLKRGFTRRSGSYHGGSLSQPSSQQIVHTFDFRVLREQGAVQSQQQSLSEFEACSLIATLMQHKLTLDAQADVAGQVRFSPLFPWALILC